MAAAGLGADAAGADCVLAPGVGVVDVVAVGLLVALFPPKEEDGAGAGVASFLSLAGGFELKRLKVEGAAGGVSFFSSGLFLFPVRLKKLEPVLEVVGTGVGASF